MRPDPWNRPIEQEEESWWWILKNPVGFVILTTIIIGFIVAVWHVLKPYPKNSEGIPVIHAPTDPLKVKPDNPGGDLIPHQDKMVYQKLVKKDDKSLSKDPQVERLVPPPALGSMFDLEKPQKKQEETVAVETKPIVPLPIQNPTIQNPGETIDELIEKIPQKPTQKEKKASLPQKTEKKEMTQGKLQGRLKGFKIQIASLPTQQKAEQEWARVKKSNKDLIGGLKVAYLTVDLGEKGSYTRIQVGGFETRNEAVSICERLKQRRVNCIVVK